MGVLYLETSISTSREEDLLVLLTPSTVKDAILCIKSADDLKTAAIVHKDVLAPVPDDPKVLRCCHCEPIWFKRRESHLTSHQSLPHSPVATLTALQAKSSVLAWSMPDNPK